MSTIAELLPVPSIPRILSPKQVTNIIGLTDEPGGETRLFVPVTMFDIDTGTTSEETYRQLLAQRVNELDDRYGVASGM